MTDEYMQMAREALYAAIRDARTGMTIKMTLAGQSEEAFVEAIATAIQDAVKAATAWQPIETAPKDRDIFVWFDHEADPYQDPQNPDLLTDYAAWAEGGDYMAGKGFCIARWHTARWESEDEYGNGYFLPAWWFAKESDDYERVVNPTHWQPLPAPPAEAIMKEPDHG